MPQIFSAAFKDKKAAKRSVNQHIPLLVVVITGIDVTMGVVEDTL